MLNTGGYGGEEDSRSRMAASREISSKGLRLCFNEAMSSPVCVLLTRGLIYLVEGRMMIFSKRLVVGIGKKLVGGGREGGVAEKVPYRECHTQRNPIPASRVRES